MEIADLEQALGFPVAAHIPNDSTTVFHSINEGIPFMLARPDSLVAQSVRKLANRLTGRAEDTEEQSASTAPIRRWAKRPSSVRCTIIT